MSSTDFTLAPRHATGLQTQMLYFYELAMSTPSSLLPLLKVSILLLPLMMLLSSLLLLLLLPPLLLLLLLPLLLPLVSESRSRETMDEERLLYGALAKTAPEHPGYDS